MHIDNNMKKKIIYIASPYTGKEAQGVGDQINMIHKVLDSGHIPYAPLLHHFAEIHRPRHYEDWFAICDAFVLKCDIILAAHGLSEGVSRELYIAKTNDIPFFFSFTDMINWINQTESQS